MVVLKKIYIFVGEDIILPFRWQTNLRLPPTGSCREATEGVPLVNCCYLRAHAVRPYGVRWRKPIVCTSRALLIHRAKHGPPSPLEKA